MEVGHFCTAFDYIFEIKLHASDPKFHFAETPYFMSYGYGMVSRLEAVKLNFEALN